MKTVSILFSLLLFTSLAKAQSGKYHVNGFDFTESSVPPAEILKGGPARDGIPSLDYPSFETGVETNWLRPSDRVLGLTINGIAKAYPIRILNYHEIVNDHFDGKAIVITYCPLCGSGMAFEAKIEDKVYIFGVSGLLYNSDVLLYDRRTESLWSQIHSEAISGPMKGTVLKFVPTHNTTWEDWLAQHPGTLILSQNTGHNRNYFNTPYQGYETSEQLFFPVANEDQRFFSKARVLGIEVNGVYKAYLFHNLKKLKEPLRDTINGETFTITYNKKAKSATILDENGQIKEALTLYWFAWYAFHPETEVWGKK